MMKVKHAYNDAREPTSLRIIEMNPQTDPRWESLMKQLPGSVIYQHPGWLGVMEEAYGYKPLHLGCEDSSGTLRGILPLYYRRGLRSGRQCISPPPVAGPLSDDHQVNALLIQAAIERSQEVHASRFQFSTRSTDCDYLVNNVVGVSQLETYELALPEQPDSVRIDSRIRRAVKKAERSGLQVRPAETMHELRVWYLLYLETMRRLLVIPQPYHVFEQAWRRLHSQGLLRLLLAEHVEAGQSRLVAGFLYFQWGNTIYHMYTGWRREDQELRPNDLLHWQAIIDACAEGLRFYDFGHAPVGNQGIAQFKAKWVAQTKTTYRYTYPTGSQKETTEMAPPPAQNALPSATSNQSSQASESKGIKQRIITPLWQHLPLKATELVSQWSRILHYY
jgi:CelD/BcsL family acetyltransferase involved in cellulose biosynthesis